MGGETYWGVREYSWWGFAVLLLGLFLLFSCCFFLSAGLGRPFLAMLLGLPLAAALLAARRVVYPFYLVEWPDPPNSFLWVRQGAGTGGGADRGAEGLLLSLAAGHGLVSPGRVRDGEPRAGTIAKALGMTALLLGIPHVLALGFLEARNATLRAPDASRVSYLAPSPAEGRWVAVSAQVPHPAVRGRDGTRLRRGPRDGTSANAELDPGPVPRHPGCGLRAAGICPT